MSTVYTTGNEYFTLEDEYCPFCGTKGVWKGNAGDYQVGVPRICTVCDTEYYVAAHNEAPKETLNLLRREG